MGQNYYCRSDRPGTTLTVRALIEQLQALADHDLPVIFRSPFTNAAYGPLTAYSIGGVSQEAFAEETTHYPAVMTHDEETGEEYEQEAWDEVFHAWKGVVIE